MKTHTNKGNLILTWWESNSLKFEAHTQTHQQGYVKTHIGTIYAYMHKYTYIYI